MKLAHASWVAGIFAIMIGIVSPSLGSEVITRLEAILNDEPGKFEKQWHKLRVRLRDKVTNNRGHLSFTLNGHLIDLAVRPYRPIQGLSEPTTNEIIMLFPDNEFPGLDSVTKLANLTGQLVRISIQTAFMARNQAVSMESVHAQYSVIQLATRSYNTSGYLSFLDQNGQRVTVRVIQHDDEKSGVRPWFSFRLGIKDSKEKLFLLSTLVESAAKAGHTVPVELVEDLTF